VFISMAMPEADASDNEARAECLAKWASHSGAVRDLMRSGHREVLSRRAQATCQTGSLVTVKHWCAVFAEVGLCGHDVVEAVRMARIRFPDSAAIAAYGTWFDGDVAVAPAAAAALAARACTGSGDSAGVPLTQDVYECGESYEAPTTRMCGTCFAAGHTGRCISIHRYPWACPGRPAAVTAAAVAVDGVDVDGPPSPKKHCP
jgi:hypothetical protein